MDAEFRIQNEKNGKKNIKKKIRIIFFEKSEHRSVHPFAMLEGKII